MFNRYCRAQRIHALWKGGTMIPKIIMDSLYNVFKQTFDSDHRGTRINDILAAGQSDIITTPGSRLSEPIPAAFEPLLRARHGWRKHEPTPSVVSLSKVIRNGLIFKPHIGKTGALTTGDSHVILSDAVMREWHPARIESIFTLKNKFVSSQIFFLVRRFDSLSDKDSIHDHYREFPIVGGRIFYSHLPDEYALVTLDEIKCHFALTPDVCSNAIRTPHIHVLPLDRVRSVAFKLARVKLTRSIQE